MFAASSPEPSLSRIFIYISNRATNPIEHTHTNPYIMHPEGHQKRTNINMTLCLAFILTYTRYLLCTCSGTNTHTLESFDHFASHPQICSIIHDASISADGRISRISRVNSRAHANNTHYSASDIWTSAYIVHNQTAIALKPGWESKRIATANRMAAPSHVYHPHPLYTRAIMMICGHGVAS